MATTPEGKVKKRVKRALDHLQEKGYRVYYHMPVQNGMGAPTLDFVGCINGRYFAIETKAPGKKATPRQEQTMAEITAAGGTALVWDGRDSLELASWLAKLSS